MLIASVRRPPVRQELSQIRSSLRNNSLALANVRREMTTWRTRSDADRASALEQTRRLAELTRELTDVQKQVNRQEAQLADVSHKVAEQDQKMLTLTQQVTQIQQILAVKSSKEASVQTTSMVKEENSNRDEKLSRKRKHVEQSSQSAKKQQTDILNYLVQK